MAETKRLPSPQREGTFPDGLDTSRICYWQDRGMWWLYLPGGGIGNLSGHTVTEHADGTITVSPSILVTSAHRHLGTDRYRRRHGFLRRGVWEPCGDDIAPVVEPREG